MATDTEVERAVIAWVYSVTGLAAGRVWPANAGQVAKAAPYIVVQAVSSEPLTLPEISRSLDGGGAGQEERRERTRYRIQIDVYGNGPAGAATARGYAQSLRGAWWGNAAPAQALIAAGVQVYASGGVRDLSGKQDTGPSPRYSLDLMATAGWVSDVYAVAEAAYIVVDLTMQHTDGTTAAPIDVSVDLGS